jgi:hypothetical protein
MEKKKKIKIDKVIINLDSREHYSSEFREVTRKEYNKLVKIENECGELCRAKSNDDKNFVKKILERKPVNIKFVGR